MSGETPYCDGCGEIKQPTDNGNCPKCGTLIQWLKLNAISNKQIHELAEKWRDKARRTIDDRERSIYNECAYEMEEML